MLSSIQLYTAICNICESEITAITFSFVFFVLIYNHTLFSLLNMVTSVEFKKKDRKRWLEKKKEKLNVGKIKMDFKFP